MNLGGGASGVPINTGFGLMGWRSRIWVAQRFSAAVQTDRLTGFSL